MACHGPYIFCKNLTYTLTATITHIHIWNLTLLLSYTDTYRAECRYLFPARYYIIQLLKRLSPCANWIEYIRCYGYRVDWTLESWFYCLVCHCIVLSACGYIELINPVNIRINLSKFHVPFSLVIWLCLQSIFLLCNQHSLFYTWSFCLMIYIPFRLYRLEFWG